MSKWQSQDLNLCLWWSSWPVQALGSTAAKSETWLLRFPSDASRAFCSPGSLHKAVPSHPGLAVSTVRESDLPLYRAKLASHAACSAGQGPGWDPGPHISSSAAAAEGSAPLEARGRERWELEEFLLGPQTELGLSGIRRGLRPPPLPRKRSTPRLRLAAERLCPLIPIF